jgi:ankyrin repeat protein
MSEMPGFFTLPFKEKTISKCLLDQGADPSRTNSLGITCFHVAAEKGHEAIVRLFLQYRANASSKTTLENRTVLHSACCQDNEAIIRLLLDYGATVSDSELCIKQLLGPCIEIFAKNGPPSSLTGSEDRSIAKLRRYLLSAKTVDGTTALHLAARQGKEVAVKLLLAYGANALATDDNGRNALFVAAIAGHETIVKLLAECGGDASSTARNGWTALMAAAERGHESVVRLLLELGAELSSTTEGGWTALLRAAGYGHLNVVRILLDHGADVSSKSEDGVTPLIAAADRGHQEVVKNLLHRGGEEMVAVASTLFVAIRGGHEGVVKILLNFGVNNSVTTEGGETPLHMAARKGYAGMVELLLDSGFKPSVDNNGLTPLHLAAAEGHEECARVCLEREPQIIDESLSERTPLHIAAEKGHEAVVRLLLQKGVDKSTVNLDGWTAAEVAKRAGHESVVKLILEDHQRVPEREMYSDHLAARLYARTFDSEHKHQTLPNGPNYIRLLHLNAPGSDEEVIDGNLDIVCLDDAPPYVALSYAWGEPKFDHHFVYDGCDILITSTLHQALKRFCRTAQRLFWVDQICINQSDLAEAGQQVSIMSRIYSQAQSVYIWLGDHDETTGEGLSMARFVVDASAEAERKSHNKGVSKFWFYKKSGMSYKETWLPWLRLFSRQWFSRLWVVQE